MTANYQKVVSLMKSHNPLLCGAVAANSIPNPPPKRRTSPRGSKKKKKSCSFGGSEPSCEELEGLLVALEAEFGKLTLYVLFLLFCVVFFPSLLPVSTANWLHYFNSSSGRKKRQVLQNHLLNLLLQDKTQSLETLSLS